MRTFDWQLRDRHQFVRNWPTFSRIPNAMRSQEVASGQKRSGFTITELLVVVAILLILSFAVLMVFNGVSGDGMRSGARIAQSAILGARDRALHAKAPRGVRFIRDRTDPKLISAIAYIAAVPNQQYKANSAGGVELRIKRASATGSAYILEGIDASGTSSSLPQTINWLKLDKRGLLGYPSARVRIPAGPTGSWYSLQPLSASPAGPPYYCEEVNSTTFRLFLTTGYRGTTASGIIAVDNPNVTCELELAYELLPYHEPILLPSGVVIDLKNSSPNVSAYWLGTSVARNVDIMFSPRGAIVGPLGALGPIHLLLNDIEDASRGLDPIDSENKREKLLLTIFPQTGQVGTFPIDPTDAINNTSQQATPDQIADDLFRYAKMGSTAGR